MMYSYVHVSEEKCIVFLIEWPYRVLVLKTHQNNNLKMTVSLSHYTPKAIQYNMVIFLSDLNVVPALPMFDIESSFSAN